MLSANKNSFLTLVRMGIGHSCVLPDVVDWQAIKALSDKQGLTAIVVDGIEEIPDTKRPPKELLLQWIGEAFKSYENRYKLYQRAIAELAGWYNTHGYKMMVMKGYVCSIDWPKPEHRPCGDIDIWVKRRKNQSDKPKKIVWGSRKDTVAYVKQRLRSSGKSDQVEVVYHHIDMGEVDGVPVEVHFTPSWAYNPLFNRRIQKWYDDEFEKQCNNIGIGGFPSPTVSFNVIYQLMHIYRHLFIEGIGLRQLLDYYFVLRKFRDESLESKGESLKIIEHLGMKKFAGTVMWVLKTVFDMPAAYMLCPPNEKEGRHMLNEIMIAGNFGTYDNRIKASSADSRIGSLIRRHAQTSRFFFSYPEEAICELPFRGWQYLWKLWNSYQ